MDNATLTIVFTALTGAISALFGLLMKLLLDRIAELKAENDTLKQQFELQARTIERNTESNEKIAHVISDLLRSSERPTGRIR